jgi:hypothetical protein
VCMFILVSRSCSLIGDVMSACSFCSRVLALFPPTSAILFDYFLISNYLSFFKKYNSIVRLEFSIYDHYVLVFFL